MKKKDIINLIKYHSEQNESGFRQAAADIAEEFDQSGDTELSQYIMSLISSADIFVPQAFSRNIKYCTKIDPSTEMLQLSMPIHRDIVGIINAVSHNAGINKFMFWGEPGTGKTESAKHLARILNRDLYSVDFNCLIDSHMGQTAKNIAELFEELNSFYQPNKVIILLDEIDSLAMDRTKSNDIREMGRATSAFMKGLDSLDSRIILIATTNLYGDFDKALIRRFDYAVDFNRYSQEDLMNIAVDFLDLFLPKFGHKEKNVRLFKKIVNEYETIPYAGELKNLIKTALAFSNNEKPYDYLRELYTLIVGKDPELDHLQGYTLREKEILTGISKSSIQRIQIQLDEA